MTDSIGSHSNNGFHRLRWDSCHKRPMTISVFKRMNDFQLAKWTRHDYPNRANHRSQPKRISSLRRALEQLRTCAHYEPLAHFPSCSGRHQTKLPRMLQHTRSALPVCASKKSSTLYGFIESTRSSPYMHFAPHEYPCGPVITPSSIISATRSSVRLLFSIARSKRIERFDFSLRNNSGRFLDGIFRQSSGNIVYQP